jgi:hypothetical protein
MTEISVLDHKEFNITETSDRLIRFSHSHLAFKMTPFEALKFAMDILKIVFTPSTWLDPEATL